MGSFFKITDLKDKLKEMTPLDKKAKIILTIGIVGILLIIFSDLFSGFGNRGKNTKTETADIYMSNEQYTKALENKLFSLVERIEGVGRLSVMVTLENGVEYVYAQEEKRNTDITQDVTGKEDTRRTEKDNTEKKYILVDGEDGKEALVLKQIEPKVKGVVIVCEGADDIRVQQRVLSAVTTALDLSSSKVCITKLSR